MEQEDKVSGVVPKNRVSAAASISPDSTARISTLRFYLPYPRFVDVQTRSQLRGSSLLYLFVIPCAACLDF